MNYVRLKKKIKLRRFSFFESKNTSCWPERTPLYRLGRSLHHLITLVNDFREMGVEFVSLQDNINTTSAQGLLMFNLFATFAEYERELIRERTLAGLEQARKRGRVDGRKSGLSKEAKSKARTALKLLRENMSIREIQEEVGIPKATYYRYIEWAKQDEITNK